MADGTIWVLAMTATLAHASRAPGRPLRFAVTPCKSLKALAAPVVLPAMLARPMLSGRPAPRH